MVPNRHQAIRVLHWQKELADEELVIFQSLILLLASVLFRYKSHKTTEPWTRPSNLHHNETYFYKLLLFLTVEIYASRSMVVLRCTNSGSKCLHWNWALHSEHKSVTKCSDSSVPQFLCLQKEAPNTYSYEKG